MNFRGFLKTEIVTIVLIAIAVGLGSSSSNADEYKISLMGGSVLTIDAGDMTIQWTDVLNNGEMKEQSIQLSNIEELILSDSPASKQVAIIREYLDQLESPDYLIRERAEEQLSDPDIGGRFKSPIVAMQEHPKLEVRYRIGRILEELDEASTAAINEFDILTLTDGTRLEGDAGNFRVDGTFRNLPISVARDELKLIARPKPSVAATAPATDVTVELFQEFEGHFYQPDQTVIEFEEAPSGAELARRKDVGEIFIPQGLLLESEKPGFVGISGFGFRYPQLPPKDNSVCVFETVGGIAIGFKGVMELRFCMPNQRAVSAGVHELGLFIANVNHSRDFIMEAYNADGQILGNVESSDQRCSFVGIKSSEPITFVRILANPYLFRTTRKIDEDFAIDNLCFSKPVLIHDAKKSNSGVVRLANGNLLIGKTIKKIADHVTVEMAAINRKIEVPLDELKSIRFSTEPLQNDPDERHWVMMLDDRSVLRFNVGEKFECQLFENLSLRPEQVTGIWLEKNKVRLPINGDFETGSTVMVFPTCRITSRNVKFQDDGLQWKQATKIEQDVDLDPDDDDPGKDDPTPDVDSVNYVDTSPENVPTIWMKKPKGRTPGTGMVRFNDGQQIVLGGSTGFEITQVDESSITISVDDHSKRVSISKILSIDFPDKK